MTFDPDFASRALAVVDDAPTPHAVILGAGASTLLTLTAVGARRPRSIRAVLDDDPTVSGDRVGDLPVCLPAAYPTHQVGHVVITSEVHEAALSRRARQLFGDRARIVYTFDRTRSLPSRLHATAATIDASWEGDHGDDALWTAADRLHVTLRDRLESTPTWRYGPRRQLDELAELDRAIDGLLPWSRLSVLNLGCGVYHPLGLSLLAWLSGAAETMAIDALPLADAARSSRALVDLVAAVVAGPTPPAPLPPRETCLARAVRAVDLDRRQADPALLGHRIESLHETTLPESSYDLVVSRDVFEHLDDVAGALEVTRTRLRPGGLAVLFIDFSDHRCYQSPARYGHWSHLIDLDEPTHLGTNRLRFPQYRPLFAASGLETVRYEATASEPVGSDARLRLAPIYREMPPEDLAVRRAVAVLRRPA